MAKRSVAEKKKAPTMLSPFNERAMSVTDKLTSEEKELFQWVVSYFERGE